MLPLISQTNCKAKMRCLGVPTGDILHDCDSATPFFHLWTDPVHFGPLGAQEPAEVSLSAQELNLQAEGVEDLTNCGLFPGLADVLGFGRSGVVAEGRTPSLALATLP